MSTYKILVAPGDNAGSGKYRCVDPHIKLQELFPNDFFVEINNAVDFSDFTYLKQFSAVFIHRVPQHNYKDAINIITNLKKLGIKVIIDIDDYWHLDPSHGLYEQVKREGIPQISINCLKLADLVVVPTSILANEVKQFNQNVVVLANALDPTEEQFKSKPSESEKLRIGWLGGSSHIKDLELIKGISSIGEYNNKSQIVLCGFDTRGSVRQIDPQTGQVQERQMNPTETVWFMYELFMTDNYRMLESYPDYVKFLVQFKEDKSFDDSNMPYRRVWTKSINQYAKNYNLFDVSLAPLVDNKFNLYKSQLKVIEAGFHKKAIIAQDFGPYQIDIKTAQQFGGVWDINGNGILIDSNKNHKDWFKSIKKLIEQPELIKQLSENLYNTVKDTYSIDKVTDDRKDLYLKLVSEKKK